MNGDEESKWDNYRPLDVGESFYYDCDLEYRKSDGAFSFHYLEKIAPVLNTVGCANTFQNNTSAKEEIALPMQLICTGLLN